MVDRSDVRFFFQDRNDWMTRVLRGSFPGLRGEALGEAVQNTVALAFENVTRCADEGKLVDADDLWRYAKESLWWAVRHTRGGRSVTGKRRPDSHLGDVYDRKAVTQIGDIDDFAGYSEDPAELGALRVDFDSWLLTLTSRNKLILFDFIVGEREQVIADKYGISQGRVSQLRKEFRKLWKKFTS